MAASPLATPLPDLLGLGNSFLVLTVVGIADPQGLPHLVVTFLVIFLVKKDLD